MSDARAETTPRSKKAEETRKRILEAALELFRERGFEETTMRAIAERASAALGSTYYYFSSKEELIFEFYRLIEESLRREALEIVKGFSTLEDRLKRFFDRKLEILEPYHRFLGALFARAADPESPISPFGKETTAIRELGIECFRLLLDGSGVKVSADVREQLPRLLWMYKMGVVLFWLHDPSPSQERTRVFVKRSIDLVLRMIRLSTVPLLGQQVWKPAIEMLREIEKAGTG